MDRFVELISMPQMQLIVIAVTAMVVGVLMWLFDESDDEYEDYLRNKKGWYK